MAFKPSVFKSKASPVRDTTSEHDMIRQLLAIACVIAGAATPENLPAVLWFMTALALTLTVSV